MITLFYNSLERRLDLMQKLHDLLTFFQNNSPPPTSTPQWDGDWTSGEAACTSTMTKFHFLVKKLALFFNLFSWYLHMKFQRYLWTNNTKKIERKIIPTIHFESTFENFHFLIKKKTAKPKHLIVITSIFSLKLQFFWVF